MRHHYGFHHGETAQWRRILGNLQTFRIEQTSQREESTNATFGLPPENEEFKSGLERIRPTMFTERAMQSLLSSMNAHVPSKRASLADLLDLQHPYYEAKDGTRYELDPKELRLIASTIDPWDIDRLKIPLLLVTDTSYEQGQWKVMGKLEVRVISKLIGREPDKPDEILVFYPHLKELRKLLPTTLLVMYMP